MIFLKGGFNIRFMKEKMPSPEREKDIKLNLDRNFFDRVEALIPDLKEDEHRRNLADLNLLTREAAFHYASGFLDQLAGKSHSQRVHESLELNFRVIYWPYFKRREFNAILV